MPSPGAFGPPELPPLALRRGATYAPPLFSRIPPRRVLLLLAAAFAATLSARREAAAVVRPADKDDAGARAAFLDVYKVLMHPRCMNCHPSGDSPLQGDDSHAHVQNVKRGQDGKGK